VLDKFSKIYKTYKQNKQIKHIKKNVEKLFSQYIFKTKLNKVPRTKPKLYYKRQSITLTYLLSSSDLSKDKPTYIKTSIAAFLKHFLLFLNMRTDCKNKKKNTHP